MPSTKQASFPFTHSGRRRKRTIRTVPAATARTAVGEIAPGVELFGLTKEQAIRENR